MTFCPQIFALLCQILSRQTFTHFLTFMSKNSQHDCVKPRGGGSRAVYTMCKKTSDLAEDGFPNLKPYLCVFVAFSLAGSGRLELEEDSSSLATHLGFELLAIIPKYHRFKVCCWYIFHKETQLIAYVCGDNEH